MKTLPSPAAQALALEEVRAATEALRAAKEYRLRTFRLARSLGVTFRSIATEAEITSSVVHEHLRRAELKNCHGALPAGDACTVCGTVEVSA